METKIETQSSNFNDFEPTIFETVVKFLTNLLKCFIENVLKIS